jgi:hypothetical protein
MFPCCLALALACATPTPAPTSRPRSHEAASCDPASGVPTQAAREESAAIARAMLDDVFASLGNEFPDEKRQFIPREQVALQRYPRLTFPALVDPVPAPAGAARSLPGWFFPLLVDWRRIGELSSEQLTGALGFWLVPHGSDSDGVPWRDITGCLVRDEAGAAPVYADPAAAGPKLLARGEALRGLVFDVPARPSSGVAPGFYDLKVLPRIYALDGVRLGNPGLAAVAASLQDADWAEALEGARRLSAASLATPTAAAELREIGARAADHAAPHFSAELHKLRDRFAAVAQTLEQRPPEGAPEAELERWRAELELALSRAERPMRALLRSIESIAPVALKDPGEAGCAGQGCVRFALAGDIQYHGDLTALQRFLAMFDPGIAQPESGRPAGRSAPYGDIDFVLFAGDLADAAAASAGMTDLALNAIGVLPPTSPYGEEGGNEMPQLRDQLAQFQKPFFGVPGNHDGYAGYGGLLNLLFDELGELAGTTVRLFDADAGRSVEGGIKSLNGVIPTGVGWACSAASRATTGLASGSTTSGHSTWPSSSGGTPSWD